MTIDTTAPIQLPVKRKPGPVKALDAPKQRRISPRISHAVSLLAENPAMLQKDAATLAGVKPNWLYKQLKKDHVNDYLARERKQNVLGAITTARAAHAFTSLLSAESEKVRADVADRLLTAAGTLPSVKGGTNVNVGVNVQAGYIVNWRGSDDASKPAIDVTPEPTD